MKYLYFNGQIIPDASPLISVQDRGFLLGDGLFETFKIMAEQTEYLAEHLARLNHGAEILGIAQPLTLREYENIIAQLLDLNSFDHHALAGRITLTRGPGPRGLSPNDCHSSTVLLTIEPYLISDHPFRLKVTSHRRNEFSKTSSLKTLGYTDNIIALREAQAHGAHDALFLNTRGFVACTTMANIFMIKNGALITPLVSDGILPGIMRQQVILQSIVPVEERSMRLEELQSADEVFITNSLLGRKRVASIEV